MGVLANKKGLARRRKNAGKTEARLGRVFALH
jgi:hypothetical protein